MRRWSERWESEFAGGVVKGTALVFGEMLADFWGCVWPDVEASGAFRGVRMGTRCSGCRGMSEARKCFADGGEMVARLGTGRPGGGVTVLEEACIPCEPSGHLRLVATRVGVLALVSLPSSEVGRSPASGVCNEAAATAPPEASVGTFAWIVLSGGRVRAGVLLSEALGGSGELSKRPHAPAANRGGTGRVQSSTEPRVLVRGERRSG
jgi:hypothetical protein